MFTFTYFEDAPVFSLDSGPREGISFLGAVFIIISQRKCIQKSLRRLPLMTFWLEQNYLFTPSCKRG